jgi:hypothetical protein
MWCVVEAGSTNIGLQRFVFTCNFAPLYVVIRRLQKIHFQTELLWSKAVEKTGNPKRQIGQKPCGFWRGTSGK